MGGKHDVPNTLFLVKKRDFLGLWYKESLRRILQDYQ